MLRKLFILLLSVAGFTQLSAQQKYSIENVKKVYLRNNGEILENNEIKGYFAFYVSDKISKKVNEYTLQILDNNLNKVKDIVFEDDSKIRVLESSYNGNTIMFLFYNSDEKTLEYRAYGFDGKQKMTYTKDLNKRSKALIDQTYSSNSEEGQNEALFSVGNQGYVTTYPVKEGKYFSYEINFFFTNKRKQWTFEAVEEQEDKICQATYLGATDSIVVFEVLKQKAKLAGHPHIWLMGLNIHNGKKAFELKTEGEDYKFFPMNISPIKGKSAFLVVGTFFDGDDNIMKSSSKGLACWTMDKTGNVSYKKYNSWAEEISKVLPASSKGKVGDVGYIYFHKILQLADGNFYAIGEGYKKVVSGAAVASKIIAGMINSGNTVSARSNVSLLKLQITDMVTFTFDEKFNIVNGKIYEKFSNSMELPNGYEMLSPHLMAKLAEAYGAFDYSFTEMDNEHSKVSIGYLDYERSGEDRGLNFHSISNNNGVITEDKIHLSSKAKWTKVFPGKPGFVTILEYYKKDKRLEFRLEKLN